MNILLFQIVVFNRSFGPVIIEKFNTDWLMSHIFQKTFRSLTTYKLASNQILLKFKKLYLNKIFYLNIYIENILK